MPSVREEYERLKFLVEKHADERCTPVVLVEQEAKKRVANAGPQPKTRLVRELDSAHAYSEFNSEFDRYIHVCENKTVAISVMLAVLKSRSDDDLRKLANDD